MGGAEWPALCRASDVCRQGQHRINMMSGKTSKVTEHLKTHHQIVAFKTETTQNNKRRREDLLAKYEANDVYRQHPGRFAVLLETMNVIVNNRPFSSMENEEAVLLRQLCYKEEFQTTLNAKIVVQTLLDIYVCAKREIVGKINAARGERASLNSIVTDFWTSEVQNKSTLAYVCTWWTRCTSSSLFCWRRVSLNRRLEIAIAAASSAAVMAPISAPMQSTRSDFHFVDGCRMFYETSASSPSTCSARRRMLGVTSNG
jgi:hypothetical protein